MNSAFQLMTSGVGTCDLESVSRDIGGVDFGLGQLFGEDECNTAGASAHVCDLRICLGSGEGQNGFDHVLGFWTRNKHGRADNKVHAPEFLMPRNVLRRNPLRTLVEGLIVTRLLILCYWALGMGIQIGTVAVESEPEEEFGIHPWGG